MLRGLRRDSAGIAILEDDLRRRAYLYVRAQGRPVSREEVAGSVGISRKLAAFHLDKLVERELLVATYARPPGRSGRGAGRSAKYYAPSNREFEVSIPERTYDVVGSILLEAVEHQAPGESMEEAIRRVARETGEAIGSEERARLKLPPPGAERAMAVATELLATRGYEPYVDDKGAVCLRSCPFRMLSDQSRDIVCVMNRELVEGVIYGLGNRTLDVVLAPTPGECCVQLHAPKAP